MANDPGQNGGAQEKVVAEGTLKGSTPRTRDQILHEMAQTAIHLQEVITLRRIMGAMQSKDYSVQDLFLITWEETDIAIETERTRIRQLAHEMNEWRNAQT